MAPSRVTLIATICPVSMCCAGAVQLLGINRIVVTGGAVDVAFKSETFPLEQFRAGATPQRHDLV